MNVVGRQKEIQVFDKLMESSSAEFVAVYGRRRVGKTYLIQQYFQDKGIYFELTGINQASKKLQLRNFAEVYTDVFKIAMVKSALKDWHSAFQQLRKKIEEQAASRKVILFLDELPWLASPNSGFLEALDLFWNRYISRNPHVILIVCGSAAAWMIKKIINNKSGLHNRLTRPPIQLMPFTLRETEEYLNARHIFLERKQLIDIYMAIGGVAYYLNLVFPGKSSRETINELFFSNIAPLRLEFQNLFSSLYQNSVKHIAVIKALATTRQGLTREELLEEVKELSSGGGMQDLLDELEHCGFIVKLAEFGKKKKEARYRLVDAYTLFYLKWVEAFDEVSNAYWFRKMESAAYYTWAGYAFENICFQHYAEIIEALKISVVAETKSGWSFKGNADQLGVQIDLIIDRADKCINLCEIKFYDDEFVIDKSYAEVLRKKKSVFREKTKTRKSLFMTMISAYGITKNSLCLEVVDQQLSMDALFSVVE